MPNNTSGFVTSQLLPLEGSKMNFEKYIFWLSSQESQNRLKKAKRGVL